MNAQRLLVWGGGGHGRVVADIVRSCGFEVVGFVDRDGTKSGAVVEPGGARVLLPEGELLRLIGNDEEFAQRADRIALGLGDNSARLRATEIAAGLLANPLFHPSASVSRFSSLGRGTIVFPNAVVNSGARIGVAVIVNSGSVIEHDCVLAEAVHLSPGAVLAGGVEVERLSWIGAGAVVLPGVRIGERAIVGAGAVVLHDVPAGATVVGNPARIIRK